MEELVSIIIPCYNSSKFIKKQIKTVLAQTHPNIECIIVDDGSTDDTGDICKNLIAQGVPVVYLYKENGGVCSARNYGIKHSNGKWIQLLDHDDTLDKDKIRFQLKFYNELNQTNGNDVALYSDYEVVFIDKDNQVSKQKLEIIGNLTNKQLLNILLQWDFKANSPLHVNNVLFKREVFSNKLFDEQLKYFEDLELFIDLLLNNIKFIYTPIVGMYYNIHSSNTTLIDKNFTCLSNAYLNYLEVISKKKRSLLKYNLHLEKLVKESIINLDEQRFNRLININQNPIKFNKFGLSIKNIWLLKIVYFIYNQFKKNKDNNNNLY